MKNNGRVTYLDTYCEGGYNYEDYKQWCADNDLEPDAEGSDHYWDWINMCLCFDVECFFDNLHYTTGAVQQPCVISGHLGLWWGEPQIENEMEANLGDAIYRCINGADAVEVYLYRGVVHVIGMHHDGRNYFEIRPLTDKGEMKMREGEDICVGNHWHTGKYPKYLY